MEEKQFINLLNRCNLSNLRILLTTNSTIIPSDELYNLLKQCKVVWVNLSVDAYGDLNSFLRKGSKWDNVTKVIDWFSEHFPGNAKVHGIISIYNVNNFYKLTDYIKEKHAGKVHVEWQMVDGPNWMQPANLPQEVKNTVLANLKNKVGDRAYSLVENEFKNAGNFDLFLDRDTKLNDIRNETWKELNPELYELVMDFIK